MSAIIDAWQKLTTNLAQAPYWPLAMLARFSLAALFWRSGQTKVTGFAVDPLAGLWQWGWPHLNDAATYLFAEEYHLPFLSPEPAAIISAMAEHVLALMLLLGMGSRIAAAGLLVMTAVIEIFVYPDAYPTHGIWATALLMLIFRGPGWLSIDHWLAKRLGYQAA